MELAARFVLGGIFVALFALLGESLKPKTFAGLFGAAPSIALAGLILVYIGRGEASVQTEARSMLFGAGALAVYSFSCSILVQRTSIPAWLSSGVLWIEWLALTLALERIFS